MAQGGSGRRGTLLPKSDRKAFRGGPVGSAPAPPTAAAIPCGD